MLAFLIFLAIVAFVFWAVCLIADRPAEPVLDPRNVQHCDTTGCPYAGWVTVTRRGTREVVEVCAGCHADGEIRGWWAA